MARPLIRFQLAGIPVQVQPWFLLVAVAGGLGSRGPAGAAVWFAVMAVSVLWHELGHALTMKAFGDSPWIELHAMGGLAHWPDDADPSPGEALLVTAAGPGAGLLLGAAVWALARAADPLPWLAELAIRDAIWVNIGWSLFNLLPILPLDGAHLLDHLSALMGRGSRPRWVGWIGIVTATAVMLLAIAIRMPYLALLGAIGFAQGLSRTGVSTRGWARLGARSSVEDARACAQRCFSRGDLAGVAAALLPEARLGMLAERDLAQLVGALVRIGREQQLLSLCRERLTAFARRDDVEPLTRLAAEALADDGADEEALAVSQLAFRQLHIAYHAYDAAAALARLDRHDEAVAWIGHAIEAGLECGDALRSDPALDPLRGRADFLELLKQAGTTSKTA